MNGSAGFPWRQVWNKKAPPKVCFAVWVLARGRMLTQNNLKARGFELASRCVFCGNAEEDSTHLIFSCGFVREIWVSFYGEMRQRWVDGRTLNELVVLQGNQGLSQAGAWYWSILHHAILWVWWLERNERIKAMLWRWGLGRVETQGITKESMIFNFSSTVYEM
ncbi:hypothetical protein ACHQM5_012130 [Ranunculus cassubicifolius]